MPFRDQLKALPTEPGVYLFRDVDGELLYIGKAKVLRARVRTYFNGGDGRPGIQRMIDRIADIEVIVTGSEAEALHLEQNLVKRHRPLFNVRLRDDKTFPYIAVTVADDFPRVLFTRERHRRGVVYFGPYANARSVRETLDTLNRVFQYRPCEGPKPGRHSGSPCLDFHIERCLAPCIGAISKEDYRALIDGVIDFLGGETKKIQRDLERKMQEAAASERYEDAARYRNRLFAITTLAERQGADSAAIGTVDVIGLASEGERAAVQVFPMRDGKLVDRFAFHLENGEGHDDATLLEAFCLEYYGSLPTIPPQIVVPPRVGDTSALAEFLSGLRGSAVEVRTPERGEKKRLQALADDNAKLSLGTDLAAAERKRQRRVEALEELREALELESLPIRIECYDISTTMGEQSVGSMVVLEDAAPKKAHYRKFAIRTDLSAGPDDFASMAEVIGRRFARSRAELGDEEWDESFATLPNLIVIDGGKGQLNAALEAMRAYDLPRVAVVSLAKRIEEVFLPGRSEPVLLDPRSAGLQLLQRSRDEAHRFALGYHRTKRATAARASIFDDLPGVGPARRKAILNHFGSADRFVNATAEEIESVPGIPPRTARTIHAALHKTGAS